MVRKLVKKITIWTVKYWGEKLERLEKGVKELIISDAPISIHFSDFRTVITVSIEDIGKAAPLLRRHIGEFLPKTI
jgi:hypothetical protein